MTMIEILEEGNKNIIDCEFCGSKLKFQFEDVKERIVTIDQLISKYKKYIQCPRCGYINYLDKENKNEIQVNKSY